MVILLVATIEPDRFVPTILRLFWRGDKTFERNTGTVSTV